MEKSCVAHYPVTTCIDKLEHATHSNVYNMIITDQGKESYT